MKRILIFFCLLGSVSGVHGEESLPQVTIEDPYIELHTGPGEGYPVFYVVDRDEKVTILKRKTDWFLLRVFNNKEGWAHRRQMIQTLTPGGEKLEIKQASKQDFSERSWELGVLYGDFKGSPTINVYGGYNFTSNLSAELTLSQVLGNYSSSIFMNVNLLAEPFPEWPVSPFFTLGGGRISIKPRTTLVQATDLNDNAAHVGLGARVYLTEQFFFRAEVKDYVVFTSDDDNREITEWRAGFAFFF